MYLDILQNKIIGIIMFKFQVETSRTLIDIYRSYTDRDLNKNF